MTQQYEYTLQTSPELANGLGAAFNVLEMSQAGNDPTDSLSNVEVVDGTPVAELSQPPLRWRQYWLPAQPVAWWVKLWARLRRRPIARPMFSINVETGNATLTGLPLNHSVRVRFDRINYNRAPQRMQG